MLKTTPPVQPSTIQCEEKPALLSLFESEETPLLRYAFSLTGRRAVAEEIVQEVFLQLHARWDEVATPRAWLMRSVRNKSFTYLRDNQRESLSGKEGQDLTSEEDELPETLLLRMEATGVLRQLLQQLSSSDQELVTLKYFHDKKYIEISEATGLSVSNVGYRLHHILKELGSKLEPLGIDGNS